MAKVFGVHEIELLPGVAAEEFERFVTSEFLPLLPKFEGSAARLAKADRGERAGKYAVIFEIESVEARNRLSPESNTFSEEGQRVVEQLAAVMAKWAAFSPTMPGQNTIYTDYIIVGE